MFKFKTLKESPVWSFVIGSSALAVLGALHHLNTHMEHDPRALDHAIGMALSVPILSLVPALLLKALLGIYEWAKSPARLSHRLGRWAAGPALAASYLAGGIGVMTPMVFWVRFSSRTQSEDFFLKLSLAPSLTVLCAFGVLAAAFPLFLLLRTLGLGLMQGGLHAIHAGRTVGLESDSPDLLVLLEAPESILLRSVAQEEREQWRRARKTARVLQARTRLRKYLQRWAFPLYFALALSPPFVAIAVSVGGGPDFTGWAFLSSLVLFIGLALLQTKGPTFVWDPTPPVRLSSIFSEALQRELRRTRPNLQFTAFSASASKTATLIRGRGPQLAIRASEPSLLSFHMDCSDLPYRMRAFEAADIAAVVVEHRIITATAALDRTVVIERRESDSPTSPILAWLTPSVRTLLPALAARDAVVDDQGCLTATVDLFADDAHVLIDEFLVLFEEFGAAYVSLRESDRVFKTLDALSIEQERSALLDECARLPQSQIGWSLQTWIEGGRGPSRLRAALLVEAQQFENLKRIADDASEELELRGQALRALTPLEGGQVEFVKAIMSGPWELALGAALALHRTPFDPGEIQHPWAALTQDRTVAPDCTLPFAAFLIAVWPGERWVDDSTVVERVFPNLSVVDSAVHPACLPLLRAVRNATSNMASWSPLMTTLEKSAEWEEERLVRVLEARKLEGRGGLTIQAESSGGDLSLQHSTVGEGALSEGDPHSEAAPDASE